VHVQSLGELLLIHSQPQPEEDRFLPKTPKIPSKYRKTKENRKKPVETEEKRLTFPAEKPKVNGGRFSGPA
jgi:hypothetical protein